VGAVDSAPQADHGHVSSVRMANSAPDPAAPQDSAAPPGRIAPPPGTGAWLLAVISFAATGTALLSRVMSPDSYYDLYVGRYILAHGIPHQNVATAAAHGLAWIDQQWLAHLAYYAAWQAGGYPAVAAESVVAETTGFALLALLMLRRGVAPSRMFAWTAAAFVVCLPNYQVEAQSFGYPLFVLTLWLLSDDARAALPLRRTWLLIPLLAVWANLHGSVLLGTGLTVCYAAFRAARAAISRDRRAIGAYLLLGAGAVAAVLCTPYGTAVLGYYRHVLGNPVLARYINRWAPPSPRDPATFILAVLALAVLAAVIVAWRRGARPDPALATACVILLGLALTAARNADWFAITGVLLGANALARSRTGPLSAVSNWFSRAIAVLFAGIAAASVVTLAVTPARHFELLVPRGAVNAAADLAAREPTWRILGDAYTGTALLWLRPDTFGRVGFDVRFEQYSRTQLAAYFDYIFARGAHWDRVTRGYQVLVISRNDSALVRAVARLPGWRPAYSDSHGVVYRRT
jgi:hypothetical protein